MQLVYNIKATNQGKTMKYFSIDYRSPPSGMGQIIDTDKPKMVGGKWNYILVDYGTDVHDDASYVETKYFYSKQDDPVMPQIIQYLREQGVTHVYDGELYYEFDGADEDGYFTLDQWAEIMTSHLWT